nr:MAG TPA: tRNA-dihydrouridine synthase/RNA Complex, FLAVIN MONONUCLEOTIDE barrel, OXIDOREDUCTASE-RNA complex [Caudoviricetes sp.]
MVQSHPLVLAPMVHVTTSYNKLQSKLITKRRRILK